MGYSLTLAVRYMGSKKRAFVSVGTAFAMLGVTLGVAALAIVMSVTGGFKEQFRDKVLGVNAHVLVLKYSIDFREYRDVMKKVAEVPGVIGVSPFVINPMMVTHGDRTATGVLLKGVDPERMPGVLDLPKQIIEGSLEGLRRDGSSPPVRHAGAYHEPPTMEAPPPPGAAPGSSARSLMQAIEDEIRRDEALLDGGVPKEPASARDPIEAPSPAPPAAAASNPRGRGHVTDLFGDVTPDGGFASELPEGDALPDFVDPAPCKSAQQVATLPGVVVGRTLAKQLGVGIGDCLQITSPTIGLAIGAAAGRPPIAKQFRVIAIFEAGFDQYDSKLVYTDLFEAQAFYEQGDSVTGVEMKVKDIDRAGVIAKQIDKLLANGVYHTMDWKELNHGLFTALLIQQIGMSVVLALIVVVAAFTVIATLIMVVLDKKKEIAVLKAIGAKDDAILRIFLYQGAIIGAVGTGLGLVLGYAGCKGLLAYGFPLDPKVYFISRLPVNLRPDEFIITGLFAIGICLVATLFPSLYASRLRPADGLRAE